LGYSFLKHWAVQIDYPRRTLRFFSKSPEKLPDDVTFRLHGMDLIDDVRVNGISFSGEIDTGQDFPFMLLPKAAKTLKLEPMFGILATPKSITVGSISVEPPIVGILPRNVGRGGVNIGNGFFKKYILTMDYPNQMVIVRGPKVMTP